MADKPQTQQSGKLNEQAIGSPIQRGRMLEQSTASPSQRLQSLQTRGSNQQRTSSLSPSLSRVPSAGLSFLRHLGEMRRFAPAPAPAPTPAPAPAAEARPEPIPQFPRFEPPSIKVPPIRRMAPQRGTTGRSAREEPILRPPPPDREPRSSPRPQRAFISNQYTPLSMYLTKSLEEQDAFLVRSDKFKPRDVTFLPPATPVQSPLGSNTYSARKESISSIAPQTPAKGNSAVKEDVVEPLSSLSNDPVTPPMQMILPVTPMAPGPYSGGGITETPAFYKLSESPVFDVTKDCPKPVESQISKGPNSTSNNLTHDTPIFIPRNNSPLSPLDFAECVPLSPEGRFRQPRPKEYRPNTAVHGGIAPDPRPCRPKTPPAGWFLTQGQVNVLCRSASMPEFPKYGGTSFAERSPAIKDCQIRSAKEDIEASKHVLDPVKFIDYTKVINISHTKFATDVPNQPSPFISREYIGEPPKSLSPAEAKILMLQLLPALLHIREGRTATLFEVGQHALVSKTVISWLSASIVNCCPQRTGITYGNLLFNAAKIMKNNWFTITAVPKFLWGMWSVPVRKLRGREVNYEWYIRVQDVFPRSIVETYNERILENYVVLSDMAYPISTVVSEAITLGERGKRAYSTIMDTVTLRPQGGSKNPQMGYSMDVAYPQPPGLGGNADQDCSKNNGISRPQRGGENVQKVHSMNRVVPRPQHGGEDIRTGSSMNTNMALPDVQKGYSTNAVPRPPSGNEKGQMGYLIDMAWPQPKHRVEKFELGYSMVTDSPPRSHGDKDIDHAANMTYPPRIHEKKFEMGHPINTNCSPHVQQQNLGTDPPMTYPPRVHAKDIGKDYAMDMGHPPRGRAENFEMVYSTNTTIPQPQDARKKVKVQRLMENTSQRIFSSVPQANKNAAMALTQVHSSPTKSDCDWSDDGSIKLNYWTHTPVIHPMAMTNSGERAEKRPIIIHPHPIQAVIEKELANSEQGEKDFQTFMHRYVPNSTARARDTEKDSDNIDVDESMTDELKAFFTNLDERYPKRTYARDPKKCLNK